MTEHTKEQKLDALGRMWFLPPEEYRNLLGAILAREVGCSYVLWPPSVARPR